jgi:hypothetical protein
METKDPTKLKVGEFGKTLRAKLKEFEKKTYKEQLTKLGQFLSKMGKTLQEDLTKAVEEEHVDYVEKKFNFLFYKEDIERLPEFDSLYEYCKLLGVKISVSGSNKGKKITHYSIDRTFVKIFIP